MVGVSLRNIVRVMADIADPSWAFSWDNVGLQLGDENAEIGKILIALDLSRPVVAEAVACNADLIISHHPLFFRPLNSLLLTEPRAELIRRLIKSDIAVYSAHTNLDKSSSCRLLFKKLGLLSERILDAENPPVAYKKIVVFVPPEHVEKVFGVIDEGGGARIGNYSYCSFRGAGVGTYRPEAGASPYAGEVGKIEKADEIRLEALIPSASMAEIIGRVRRAHPYEEVALDVYSPDAVDSIGIGRVGDLPEPMELSDWGREVKKRLGIKTLRLTGDTSAHVARVAVVAGSGGGYIEAAGRYGAQCLVTGDVGYHQARQAEAVGMGLLDVGHYSSERLIVEYLVDELSSHPELSESGVEIRGTESERDPFLSL
jgi:dinuclear metal center YbgI/SA1388 family protein